MSASSTERRAGARGSRRRRERGLIAFLGALSGLSAMGIDVLLPGLSNIRAAYDLAPDSTQVSLIITVYLFGLGTGQIFFGPIADRFGRKPTVLIGLGVFAAGAIGSALAPTLTMMLAFRFVMGVGATSPRAMSLTIARDRFSGDAMTRVVSLVMLFFQLSPAVAPLLGEGLLVIGPWQGIFVFAARLAVVVMLWTTTFAETLADDRRLPLTFARTAQSARAIVGSRWALGHGLVLMFEFTAFYVYLSSSELVFDDVFGRGDLFAVWLRARRGHPGGGNLSASRLAPRFGTARLMAVVVASYVGAGAVFYLVTACAGAFTELLGLARAAVDAQRPACARVDDGQQPGDATVGRTRRDRIRPDRHDVDDGRRDHVVVRGVDDRRVGDADGRRVLSASACWRVSACGGPRRQRRAGRTRTGDCRQSWEDRVTIVDDRPATERAREETAMIDKPYTDIPGTTVFDADRSRQGLLAQPVLHVADARRQPRSVQA